MRLLLDDRFAPITSDIGFIETDPESAADYLVQWHRDIYEPLGVPVESRELNGNLPSILEALLPLTNAVRTRYLFVPTRSRWTAYFDNGWRGADVFSHVSFLAEGLQCRGLRVTAVPHTIKSHTGNSPGRYGAVMLELYGPKPNPILNYERVIAAANDGGSWVFREKGEHLPFEDPERYKARRKRDRFTFEMLRDYTAALGLRPFDEDFYVPDQRAILVEHNDRRPLPGRREYSLREARRGHED